MRREDKVVLTQVPPGPENPLGKHWVGLSIPGIGIHGTLAPASIYHFQSHGCIRLHPATTLPRFSRKSQQASPEKLSTPRYCSRAIRLLA